MVVAAKAMASLALMCAGRYLSNAGSRGGFTVVLKGVERSGAASKLTVGLLVEWLIIAGGLAAEV